LVAGITKGFLLVAMQQRLRLRDVIDVRRSADHGMHESRRRPPALSSGLN